MTLGEIQILMGSREHEHLEFKEAKNSFSVLGDNGKNRRSVLGYCVALGNEGGGKLILGISEDTPRRIVSTSALADLGDVKSKIYNSLGIRIETEEIFDINNRIVVIHIPSRPHGRTLKFYGVPLMRIGEELKEMDDATLGKIINENKPDWSAGVCVEATFDDLDSNAISIARENYKTKNPRISKEVDGWDDVTFLNKAKLIIKGKITNTAIILLGKPESAALISPSVVQISWILKGENGVEKDYEHFSCPLLLSVNKVYARIRNLKYRYIQEGSLFPEEIDMYAPYVIREALNNCIAHQDYSLHGRIQVVENEDGYLIFSNKGKFLPGSVEKVINADSPQEYYQNKFLVDAMVNVNMIDTIGSGIKTMFSLQQKRFFPLPSYDFSEGKVAVKIIGKVLDLNYAKILAQNKNLTLNEIMLLDQIQKKIHIPKNDVPPLREKNLVEGRYPNIHISRQIAEKTGEKAKYLKNKGLDDPYYKKLVLQCLEKYPGSSRKDIDDLLISKLPEILSLKQKKNRVTNLLYSLSKREQKIKNIGTNRNPKWEIK